MATDKHYIGEIDTEILVDVGQDIESATTHVFKVKKPDGTIVTWDAELHEIDGVHRYLRYHTVEGDFDQAGQYELQVYVTPGSWEGHGSTAQFMVYNLFA